MPILNVPPPEEAEDAVNQAMEMLAAADRRFASFRRISQPNLSALAVIVSGLDVMASEIATQNLASRRYWYWREWRRVTIWRFFVKNESQIGVVEVAPRVGGDGKYEFLAFREGAPVERAAEILLDSRTFPERSGAEGSFGAASGLRRKFTDLVEKRDCFLHLLKIPGLCADFYWVGDLDFPDAAIDGASWLIPIFPGAAGFSGEEILEGREAFGRLREESQRVLNSNFVRRLDAESESSG
jgi:hypothetical protein